MIPGRSSAALYVSKYSSIGGGDAVFILKTGAFSCFKAGLSLSSVSLVPYEGSSDVLAESGPASEERPPS